MEASKDEVLFFLKRLIVDKPNMEQMKQQGFNELCRKVAVDKWNSDEQKAYRTAYEIIQDYCDWEYGN